MYFYVTLKYVHFLQGDEKCQTLIEISVAVLTFIMSNIYFI